MQIGKVPGSLLNELVLKKMKRNNERALLSGGVGEDVGVLDFGGDYCAISCDPITGASKLIGKTSVYVACNDIAACGVSPVAILATILLPPGTSEAELGALADDMSEAAEALGVSVIGGHTEVTDAVTRTVISVTAVGAAPRGALVTSGGAKAGDALIMTKSAGLEGAAIIAAEREQALSDRFGPAFVKCAKGLSDHISVVREGVAAGGFGVSAMHDVTEGGVLGAAWEMAEASGKGVVVYADKINVLETVRQICDFYGADVHRMVSSGSMLIATDRADELTLVLDRAGVPATEIGYFTSGGEGRVGDGGRSRDKGRFYERGGVRTALAQPGPDELYRVLRSGAE